MIVEVTWIDAERGDDSPDKTGNIGVTRHTVGHVIERTDAGIVIAMSRDVYASGREDFERWFAIPAAYVVKVRKLS